MRSYNTKQTVTAMDNRLKPLSEKQINTAKLTLKATTTGIIIIAILIAIAPAGLVQSSVSLPVKIIVCLFAGFAFVKSYKMLNHYHATHTDKSNTLSDKINQSDAYPNAKLYLNALQQEQRPMLYLDEIALEHLIKQDTEAKKP